MNDRMMESVFAVGLAVSLAACGGSSGGGSPAFVSAAEGIWLQNCFLDVDDGDYRRDALLIDGRNFTVTQHSFSDDACANASQSIAVAGTFEENGPEVDTTRGPATAIDLTITNLVLTFHTAALVDSANNSALCDVTNWSVDVSVDVSNCADISDSNVPREAFDIYRREDTSLYTSQNQADTADARPTSLDESRVFLLVESDNGDPGSGTNGGTVVLPEDSLVLTADNGLGVAQFVMQQFDIVKGLTNAGITGVISGAGNTEGRVTDLYISSSCEGGGSATINGTPAILATLSAAYTGCMIDGTTFNGSMVMNFVAVNGVLGDPTSDWSFSAAVTLTGFSVDTGTRDLSIDGDFDLTLVYLAETEVSGGATARFQGIQDEVLLFNEPDDISRMIDFDFVFTYSTDTSTPYTDDFDEARIASSVIGGQITVEDASGFSGTGFSVPSSGELEIFGANSTRIVIDAEDDDMAIISVDADGNALFTDDNDLVQTGSWSGFFGS